MDDVKTSRSLRNHPAVVASLVIAVVLGVLWLVDSAFAARAEARLSAAAEESAGLQSSPKVYIGGAPFAQVLVTGEIPMVSLDVLDVDVAGLGIVNARTEFAELEIPAADAYRGDVVGSPVSAVTRSVSLDGVALGQVLDMTDLDIKNPYDISPGGGVAAEAQLTGTPDGFREPVSVLTKLRLDAGEFSMRVTDVLTAPEGREQDVVDAFTLTRDTTSLPIGGPATAVYLAGGSITFEHSRYRTVIAAEDLVPDATGNSEFTREGVGEPPRLPQR